MKQLMLFLVLAVLLFGCSDNSDNHWEIPQSQPGVDRPMSKVLSLNRWQLTVNSLECLVDSGLPSWPWPTGVIVIILRRNPFHYGGGTEVREED